MLLGPLLLSVPLSALSPVSRSLSLSLSFVRPLSCSPGEAGGAGQLGRGPSQILIFEVVE